MRNIIIATLLLSGSLMAADKAQTNATGGFSESINGAAFYKQHCSKCHGDRGEKSPEGSAPLAGRDATILALTIRAYRDQSNEIGAYTMHKSSQMMKDATVNLSDRHIGALAKYISGLQ
ncbi:MAG: c-type cytochrome [Campylobacterota bacterium]